MLKQTAQQSAKQRVGWIDLAKGAAILLVLWGHAMRDPMRVEKLVLDYFYRVVYTFHMAFFFRLSGCVHQMTRGKPALVVILICLAASIVLPLMVERVTARFPVHL